MFGKYTPGPWKISEVQFDSTQVVVTSPEGFVANTLRGNDRANAQLIAMAPELAECGYNLLMEVLQSDLYHQSPDVRDAVDNLYSVWKQAVLQPKDVKDADDEFERKFERNRVG